jgi:hypothetical protein
MSLAAGPMLTRAYCLGGAAGCKPLTIYGTPRVPEHEAAKVRRQCSNVRTEELK